MKNPAPHLLATMILSQLNIVLFCSDVSGESITKMYWSIIADTVIYRSNLDGSQREALTRTGGGGPTDIAIDSVERKMYWASPAEGGIQRANLDGSDIELFLATGGTPHLVDFDEVSRDLFWTKTGGEESISRFNLITGETELLVPNEVISVIDAIEVDDGGEYIYWIDRIHTSVRRTRISDSVTEIILDASSISTGIGGRGLALDEGTLYVSDGSGNSIISANIDGSNPKILITESVEYPEAIAFDKVGQRIYWANNRSPDLNIWSANKDGTDILFVLNPKKSVSPDNAQHLAFVVFPVPEQTSFTYAVLAIVSITFKRLSQKQTLPLPSVPNSTTTG